MVTQLFTDLLARAPNLSESTAGSTMWLREQAKLVRGVSTQKQIITSNSDRLTTKPVVGRMYLFMYDPKHKDTLPYYDRFPLVFPFQKANNGFYGINMHYLPHMLRARLMDALYQLINNNKMDDTTKLRLSYKILLSSSKYRFFKPCVKHYLNSQLETRFLWIPIDQWDTALFLPLERFVGATRQQVFNDSRRMVR